MLDPNAMFRVITVDQTGAQVTGFPRGWYLVQYMTNPTAFIQGASIVVQVDSVNRFDPGTFFGVYNDKTFSGFQVTQQNCFAVYIPDNVTLWTVSTTANRHAITFTRLLSFQELTDE